MRKTNKTTWALGVRMSLMASAILLASCANVTKTLPSPTVPSGVKNEVQPAPSVPAQPEIHPTTGATTPESTTPPPIETTPAQTATAPTIPTQPVETTTQRVDQPTAIVPVAEPRFTVPTITDKYPLVKTHFGMTRPLALSPGKIWVGTGLGLVDVFDSKDGHLIQSVALFPDAQEKADSLVQDIASANQDKNKILATILPALKPIEDLGFDGKNIWAVASWTQNHASGGNVVLVIDPADGKIIRRWDSSRWLNTNLESGFFPGEDDMRLGFSPGKAWTMGKVIDTETFEMEDFMTSSKMVDYAYDGKGWMWMSQLSPVEHHEDLIAYNVDNPEDYRHPRYNPAYAFKIGGGDPIVVAGGKLWDASEEALLSLPADGGKFDTGFKAINVIPMKKGHPDKMVYDGHSIWLLKSDETYSLFQIDPISGKILLEIDVTGDPDTMPPDLPSNIAFDGHDLWLLSAVSFSRIVLPYMR